MLGEKFGHSTNAKGYTVLAREVRVIQGDGVNPKSIALILERLLAKGWSAENIAFGMGGALVQKINHDTLRFAMKANARQDGGGKWYDHAKAPATDASKASKAGRVAVYATDAGDYGWCRLDDLGARADLLKSVWRNGEFLHLTTLAEVRGAEGAGTS